MARNASTHAAGVVISREPLTELMPLQKATNSDGLMTQYEMHAIEALGLLKFDFLGLSNLTILRQAVDTVKAERGTIIDLDAIPLDDAKTFELLASGETTGIFQLESAGMRRYIRELRPTSVYDLAAMVALYRPGPMDNIPAYIRRKHGQEPVTYLHPLLEPYLEKTYGIFVYQEDIMSAAMALGGFTGPEADTLGYAIRKKKSAVLRAQKEKFVTQAAERGVPAKTIDDVFAAFEPFERYGFNKAHATCYGLIAYQTAYLKANYTVEYMTAVLTAFRSNEEKVAAAVAECRRMGIEVLPPDVHSSQLEFTVEGEAIRFGLLAVKNVGASAIESIIAARDEGGPFTSLTDFCTRIDLRLCNRKVLEALAKVGALDAFGHPRQILDGLDDAVLAAQATQRDRISGQTSLFDMGAADAASLVRPLPDAPEAPMRERLRWEKELLGLYLSEHPMGEVAAQVGQFVNAYSGDLKDESLEGQRIVVGGIVTGIRTVITKAKATMLIVTMEDLQGTIEVVVFPRLYEQTGPIWRDGSILLVAGRVDHRGEEVSLLADLVAEWDDAVVKGPEAFARDVAAGDRGARRKGPPWANGNGNGNGNGGQGQPPRTGTGAEAGTASRPMIAVGPGPVGEAPDRLTPVLAVSPLRAEAVAAAAPYAPVRPRGADPDLRRYARGRRRWRRTGTTTRPCRTKSVRGSWPTRRPTTPSTPGRRRSSTCDSDRTRRPIAIIGAMETIKIAPARPSGCDSGRDPHPGARTPGPPCRWSCVAASPTTRNSSRTCVAGSAMGSWSCRSSAPDRQRRITLVDGGLGALPARDLLGREPPVVVQEVAAARLERRRHGGLPHVAPHLDHHDRAAGPDGLFVMGEVDELIHHREVEDPADPRGEPVRRAAAVEAVRPLLAAQDRDVAIGDPEATDRGRRLGRPGRVAERGEHPIDWIADESAGSAHGAGSRATTMADHGQKRSPSKVPASISSGVPWQLESVMSSNRKSVGSMDHDQPVFTPVS